MTEQTLDQIVSIHSKDTALEYFLYSGIHASSVLSLIAHSQGQDEAVTHFTSDKKRFADHDAFEKWLQKGRSIYTLLSKSTSQFAGIVWFGPEPMPVTPQIFSSVDPSNFGATFAIRLYDEARGKGLALPFMKETFSHFMNTVRYAELSSPNFWLETSSGNTSAITTYTHFGFSLAAAPDEQSKIMMVYQPNQDSRT